jgi:hypothetical protein
MVSNFRNSIIFSQKRNWININPNQTKMRYYLTPQIDAIQKTKDNKGWWGYREMKSFAHC